MFITLTIPCSELTLRLQQHQSSETSGDILLQSIQDQLIVKIFEALAINCLDGLMEITSELQETFMVLIYLHPQTASDLVHVLYPLFAVFPSLGDRCSLSLRKASFSKDMSSRQTAVCSLTTLLRAQLMSHSHRLCQVAVTTSQPDGNVEVEVMSQHEHLTQRLSIGISVDEVLSLCRRFLQHQSSVKSLLYNNLAQLHNEFAYFRPLISQLFRNHLMHLLHEDISFDEGDLVFASDDRGILTLNVDRCIDSSGNSLEVC